MSLFDFIKSKQFFKNLGIITAVFFVILIIAFVGMNFYTRHGKEYIMPEIEGSLMEDIDQIEEMDMFKIIVLDSIYTPGEHAGKIISQDPKAESKIKKGRKIYVVVTSSIGENIPMPNCKDQSVRSAVNQLTNAGLRVGKFIFNIGDFNNVVVGQRYRGKPIEEGSDIQRGEEIDLIVEMNQEKYSTTMPNIIGLTEPEAEKKLWEAALNVGKKTFEGKKDIVHSRVVSFSPNTTSVSKGSTITINFMNDTKSNYKDRVKKFKMSNIAVEDADIQLIETSDEL
ncbi:MAG: PASTA domain-containing protein [Bacteroidales bacterium]|jgi:beta-lactam-binding protein with PASTA domain|nr:PASTA domain-containing protein [Bacteroidales bacterium]MDD4703490.1 PASTA domain-containing protein [Bacteroidales bacterium]MDX9798642.1 PASTA domain-containing protein [Bacteroidales bacterium]